MDVVKSSGVKQNIECSLNLGFDNESMSLV